MGRWRAPLQMEKVTTTTTNAPFQRDRIALREQLTTSLRRLLDLAQSRLSLNVQRGLLLLFLLLQGLSYAGYLAYAYMRIEDDAVRVLRNTALLEAQQFETSMDAMRYQVRFIGNAFLLNHTVSVRDAEPFLEQELKKDWLDALIVIDANGDFVAKGSLFPLEQVLDASVLARASFRDRPLFKDLRREEVNERLFSMPAHGTDPALTSFVMYRAIRDPGGRYIGAVLGYLNSSTMAKLFTKMEDRGFDLGPSGVMGILDKDTGITLNRMGGNSSSERTESSLSQLLSYANDSAFPHRYVSPIDGVRRLGVFLNLNERKWVFVVGLAENDFLNGWYQQVLLTIAAFVILAILQWSVLHYEHANFKQRERLAREAQRDPLTDLANRRYFDEWAQGTCSLARRHRQALCVLTFDLDFFKTINDSYGHDGGDAVLSQVARTLRGLLRSSDFAARFGGEEFVVALPQTPLDEGEHVAERIRASLAEQKVEFRGRTICFTASFGVALMTPYELEMNEGIHAALSRADNALYRSKQEGRNRVTVAG